MPHPFFQSPNYPFHREDARALHRALWKTIDKFGRIEQLYNSAGTDLLPLDPGSADLVWTDALKKLAAAGRLEALCDLLLADPNSAAIRPMILAVRDAEDIIEQVLLPDGRVFVDRQQLREKLQRLANSSPSFPVLLIRGAADSGKSWTQYMVSALAREQGQTSVYLFQGLVSDVHQVLEMLFATFGEEKVPDQLTTDEAWFQKVCVNLMILGKKSQKICWVVMDDLGDDEQGSRFEPRVRKFFDQFVLSMANPAFAEWFRLVLIDYPDLTQEAGVRGVPTRWRDIWDEDRPDVTQVNAEALAAFVTQWAQRKNKQLAATAAESFATDVLTAVDSAAAAVNPARPRLQTIHDELVMALKKL